MEGTWRTSQEKRVCMKEETGALGIWMVSQSNPGLSFGVQQLTLSWSQFPNWKTGTSHLRPVAVIGIQ